MQQDSLLGFSSEQDDVLALVGMSEGHTYRLGFANWARENWGIVKAFIAQADLVRSRGRTHYSARTLVEWLRHESALREAGGIYKLDGNWVPSLSRLYMELRKVPGFFEVRNALGQ